MAFVGVATALVVWVEPAAAGSGIPDVKAYLNGTNLQQFLTFRALVCKVIGVMFSVGGGARWPHSRCHGAWLNTRTEARSIILQVSALGKRGRVCTPARWWLPTCRTGGRTAESSTGSRSATITRSETSSRLAALLAWLQRSGTVTNWLDFARPIKMF